MQQHVRPCRWYLSHTHVDGVWLTRHLERKCSLPSSLCFRSMSLKRSRFLRSLRRFSSASLSFSSFSFFSRSLQETLSLVFSLFKSCRIYPSVPTRVPATLSFWLMACFPRSCCLLPKSEDFRRDSVTHSFCEFESKQSACAVWPFFC